MPAYVNSLAARTPYGTLAQPVGLLLQGSLDLSSECETFVVCSYFVFSGFTR
jgi:hypothetical protein